MMFLKFLSISWCFYSSSVFLPFHGVPQCSCCSISTPAVYGVPSVPAVPQCSHRSMLFFSIPTGSVSINQSNNPLNGQDGFTQLNTSNQRSFQILTDFVREETQQLRGLIMSQATELQRLQQLGKTSLLPASSCREIKQMYSNSPSGYYWIQGSGSSGPVRMYCDMTRSCKGVCGGWMRSVHINMDNHNHNCPAELQTLTSHGRPRCSSPVDGVGCTPVTFKLHDIPYTKVCGRVIAYQQGSPDAFWPYYRDRSLTIDDNYVDGASLTHGHYPISTHLDICRSSG